MQEKEHQHQQTQHNVSNGQILRLQVKALILLLKRVLYLAVGQRRKRERVHHSTGPPEQHFLAAAKPALGLRNPQVRLDQITDMKNVCILPGNCHRYNCFDQRLFTGHRLEAPVQGTYMNRQHSSTPK
jgi:hypothetical protein